MPLDDLIPCWYCGAMFPSNEAGTKRYCRDEHRRAASRERAAGTPDAAPAGERVAVDGHGNPLPDAVLRTRLVRASEGIA